MKPDPAAAPQSELLDYRQLESWIDLGIDAYRDLLNDVIRDIPDYLDRIRIAIKEANSKELKAQAHSLRGTLLYFGCLAMASRLARLDDHETVTPDQATDIHAELQALWNNSLAAVRDWEKSVADFAP